MENDRSLEISKKNNLKLAPETMRIRDAIIEKYSDRIFNRESFQASLSETEQDI